MKIDLEFKGGLPSGQGGNHSDTKQELRLAFSPQLRRKWRDSPQLSFWNHDDPTSFPLATKGPYHYELDQDNPSPFLRADVCGYYAIPLVSWHNRLACELAVTIVGDTRSAAEAIGAGDLDNRLKVLFDGLRIPRGPQEVPGTMFGKDEPLYCLLEDDSLIHKFSVEAIQSPFSPAEYAVRIKATIEQMDGTHGALDRFR